MLNDHLFKIASIQNENAHAMADLELNPGHDIFMGHFPEHPVLPGACMIQMVKEITEIITDKKLILTKAPVIKFLALINPTENRHLQMNLTYATEAGAINVSANLSSGASICFRLTGSFEVFSISEQ